MSLWFGYEWEIAVSGKNEDGSSTDPVRLLDRFDAMLVKNLRHVDSEVIGWWLDSGGKFYRDASESGAAHNEYASPECSHPDELLHHDIAAERLLLRLAELTAVDGRFKEVRVSKANVSHASGTSWGSHENYEASQCVALQPMLAWLASRILLTGAGGLDVTYPGIRFTLSPRAHFIEQPVNNATQWGRGLHNVGKAAPYGTKHRVHVVAGDGNRAPLSTWLRFATTALVIRMIDTGRAPTIGLMDPVSAMHAFALDPGLAVAVMAEHGSPSGILAIQRSFLQHAQAATDLFPDWAPRVLMEWQRILDAFEAREGWRKLIGHLDWPTKLALFEKVLQRRGWTWERVNEVNRLVEQTATDIRGGSPGNYHAGQRGPVPNQAEILRMAADEHDPEVMREFTGLKQQLAVVDARYMELGGDSLFGHVAVPAALKGFSAELPEDMLDLPLPRSGRARVRAEKIRELGWKGDSKQNGERRIHASWTNIFADGKVLAMPDVASVDDLTWHDVPTRHDPVDSRRPFRTYDSAEAMLLSEAIQLAESAIDTGTYGQAAPAIASASEAALSADIPVGRRVWYWKNTIRIYARQQRETEISAAVEILEGIESPRVETLWEACNARTWLGLAGHAMVPELALQVETEMQSSPHPRLSGIACWKSHLAFWLNHHGRPGEALQLLETTRQSREYAATSESVKARIEAQCGEARRMFGEYPQAQEYFKQAELLCRQAGLDANLLDYVFTGQARLAAEQGDQAQAYQILLDSVLPRQRQLGMPNQLRTMMLMARRMPDRENRMTREDMYDFIAGHVSHYSGFASCPLVAKVLDHWDDWCNGEPDPAPPDGAEVQDTFWGV